MSKAKTLADFRANHDPSTIIPNKIRSALASMLKEGSEQWEYESDFAKRAGLGQQQISAYREEFSDHVVVAPSVGRSSKRNVWFADPKVAKKLKGA